MGSYTVTTEVAITIVTMKTHLLVKQSQVVLVSFLFVLSNMTVLKSSPANGWACVLCLMGGRLAVKGKNPPSPALPFAAPVTFQHASLLPGAHAGSDMVAGGSWRAPCNWGPVWELCPCIQRHLHLGLCSQPVHNVSFGHSLSGLNKLNVCKLCILSLCFFFSLPLKSLPSLPFPHSSPSKITILTGDRRLQPCQHSSLLDIPDRAHPWENAVLRDP